jgi:hypothetical protein
MRADGPVTLKEVQLRLGVPQHVLIHLCEKGVVQPDLAETSGRGKRREFSQRNVFEFAVALALRRFELPVATTALIVRVLRAFTRTVAKALPDVGVPSALADGRLALVLHLYDAKLIVLSAAGPRLPTPLLWSARIGNATHSADAAVRIMKHQALPETYEARLELDLSEIARNAA